MAFSESYEKIFVGGEWILPHSGRSIPSIDPSTEEVWAEIPESDETDADLAVQAARAALDGPWTKTLTASERGGLILKLAQLLKRDARRLAEIESRDNGKPLRETLSEMQRAVDWLTFFAGAADKINGEQIPFRPDALAYTRREPMGVVAAILPWNSPIMLTCWKLGPALATGNTVVLKPAEQTSVSALEFAKLIEEAGFPDGVVNLVPGYGARTGSALSSHPGVNKISFTGDHRTAQKIMQAASINLKRCSFECGGKAAHILFSDAELDKALIVAVQSAFRSTGQSCSLGSRLFVERPIYEEVVAEVAKRTSRIRVGPPFDEKVHIGPHTSAEQLAKTNSYIALGKSEGFRLVAGGGRPAGFDRGYYVEPTVFADVDAQSRLACEEIFGPVLSIIPFDDQDEVVEMANSVPYGLVSGLWTSDIRRAHHVAARLEAGLVSINTFRPVHWMLPYGGYKLSGFGRENGLAALDDFVELKTIVVELSDRRPADPFLDA